MSRLLGLLRAAVSMASCVVCAQSVPADFAFPERRASNDVWNVSLVIDCSQMAGPEVRTQALDFLGDLGDDDVVSVVAYADHIRLVAPPGRLGDRREDIVHEISALPIGGGAALFAGISIGAMQLRKNEKLRRPNLLRVFCQGRGTVGPSRADLMARLAVAFRKSGICAVGLPGGEGPAAFGRDGR